MMIEKNYLVHIFYKGYQLGYVVVKNYFFVSYN